MARLKLSSPWIIYYKEVDAFFKEDPEVNVVYDEEENTITLYVANGDKADALTQLLPVSREFGDVSVRHRIIPGNLGHGVNGSVLEAAFKNNNAVSYIKTIHGLFSNDLNYVVFKKEVVQYFNDDLGDINGMCSTLYQNIAKNIFIDIEGLFFCTDINSTNNYTFTATGFTTTT